MLQTSICARTPAGNGSGWNDARVDLLRKLWADGLSASQIAGQAWARSRATPSSARCIALDFRCAANRRRRPRRTSPAPADRVLRRPRCAEDATATCGHWPRLPPACLPPAQLDLPLDERVTRRGR